MKASIKVPRHLVRRFEDPSRENVYVVHAYPKAMDLPGDIPLTPDPRKPKEASTTVRRIERSLLSNDGRFHLLNRGITLSAASTKFDAERGILIVELPDAEESEKYGILDGGHTYDTVCRVTEKRRMSMSESELEIALGAQHVHLEILANVEPDLADIAEARNFSVSLKAWSLAGYKNQFEWLLKAVGPSRRKYIKISENDAEPVGVLEVIQVLAATNNTLFPEGEPALEAYKNAGKCLDYFVDESDKYGFKAMAPVVSDVLALYDRVRRTWKDKYNAADEVGTHGRLGRRRENEIRKRGRRQMTTYYFENPDEPWIGGEDDFPVEKGLAIPAMSSLRPLLVKNKAEVYEWYVDPFEFWDRHGQRVVKSIMTASENVSGNPHVVGRDAQVYRGLYTMVRGILVDEFLAREGRTLPF